MDPNPYIFETPNGPQPVKLPKDALPEEELQQKPFDHLHDLHAKQRRTYQREKDNRDKYKRTVTESQYARTEMEQYVRKTKVSLRKLEETINEHWNKMNEAETQMMAAKAYMDIIELVQRQKKSL